MPETVVSITYMASSDVYIDKCTDANGKQLMLASTQYFHRRKSGRRWK